MTTSACRDRLVFPVLRALRNCVSSELAGCGRNVCYFPIVFNGGHPPADACDCTCPDGDGQAWVRLVSVNAHNGVGSKLAASACGHGQLDLTVETGIYRCSPVPLGGAATVDEDTMTAHAENMYLDSALLRRALLCCELPSKRGPQPLNAVLTTQSAIGPSGGCVGIETQGQLTRFECDCNGGTR